MPGGETYRVTGRPHSESALALLIEDISSEITLTRSFRAELEVLHAAFDDLDQSVGAFSSSGTLIFSNAAYDANWSAGAQGLKDQSFTSESAEWQARTTDGDIWHQVIATSPMRSERPTVTQRMTGPNGMIYDCRISPLTNGATLVRFKPGGKVASPLTLVDAP